MKAIEILDCIMYMGLNGADLTKIEVPSINDEYAPQNDVWWKNTIGCCPTHPIKAGIYLVYFSCNGGLRTSLKEYKESLKLTDDEGCPIYLYKVED